MAKRDIVLIHGLWMTPLSWEHWIDRYTSRGHRVLAPAWPGLEADVQELRRNPSALAGLGAKEILDSYDQIIRDLDAPPIIMGHSFGGGFVQVLLDRGLGSAGVAIDAATTKGVLKLPLSTVRSTWSILKNPANRKKAVPFSEKNFRYAFANTLNEEESLAAYERYAIPASGRVLFQGALANFSSDSPFRVDYAKDDRAPLLFIAGGSDHVVPAVANKANFKKYKSKATVEYKEFPGRSHFTVGQKGWEEVADYALDWATKHASPLQVAETPPAVTETR
jgi:alpha-beta hydrolase superfamily lysophospholipase